MARWHNPTIIFDELAIGHQHLPKPVFDFNVSHGIDRQVSKVPMSDGVLTAGDSKAGLSIVIDGQIQELTATTVDAIIESMTTALQGNAAQYNEFRLFSHYNTSGGYCRWYERCVLEDFSYNDVAEIETEPWRTVDWSIRVLVKDPIAYTTAAGGWSGDSGTFPTALTSSYTTTITISGPLIIKGALIIRDAVTGNAVAKFDQSGNIQLIGALTNPTSI